MDDQLESPVVGDDTEEIDVPLTVEEITDYLTNLALRMHRAETLLGELIPVTEATSGWMAAVTTNRAGRRSVAMKARKGGRGAYAGKPGRGKSGN